MISKGTRALVAVVALAAGPLIGAVVTALPAAAVNNGLALTPPMGWNSWNQFGCSITEAEVKAAADAMVSDGLKAHGYQYVNIDDCWQAPTRDAAGNLAADPTRFPDGIKALANYVHADGLKLGIYATPGSKTCGEIWNGYPGTLGSLGHEQQDANTFAAWGVDYLKYDWCQADQNRVVASSAFPLMENDLKATGRPILFSIHDEPEQPVPSWRPTTANMWRTTVDIHDNWSSMISNAHQNQPLAAGASPGAWNDPDMLEVGNGGMTDAEYRTHFSLWSEMAAPLIAGDDLRTASTATLQILGNTDVIAVDQDGLGRQGTVISSSGGLVVMSKPLANGDRAVTLTNENSAAQTVTTTASAVGIGGAATYSLKDLWTKAVSSSNGVISASVAAHSTVMYRVSPNGVGTSTTFEAEAPGNTVSGAASVASCSACSGGQKVGWIGNGASNYVVVNGINESNAGTYTLTISSLVSGTRSFKLSVNGGPDQVVNVTGTSWDTPANTTVSVALNAGANTIKFHNDTAYAPDLDAITIS